MQTLSGIRPPDCSKLAENLKNDNDVTIFWHDLIVKFFWGYFVSLVKFRYWYSIITGSGIMKFLDFFFIRDWAEIWKSETPTSEFYPISGDWDHLWIPKLARMSLIECYWMLQNSRVTALSVFQLLKEHHLGRRGGG